MNTHTFPLAPRPGSHEWGQALAFALPPGAGIYAVIHWIVAQPVLGLIIAPIVFLGVFLSALLLIRPQIGVIELESQHLRLLSGALDVRIPLDSLELLDGPASATDAPSLSLVTDPARRLSLALRTGGTVALSPLDPASFIQALRQQLPAPALR